MAQRTGPDRVMRMAQSFMESRVLLTAVELGLFTCLSQGERSLAEISVAVGLHERGAADFLDTLVCLGLLERRGQGTAARYRNSAEAELFLSTTGRLTIAGLLEMMGGRLYHEWADLTNCLRTGRPRADYDDSLYGALYEGGEGAGRFAQAMSAASRSGALALMRKVDFSPYQTLVDAGGSTGQLAVLLARHCPRLRVTVVDLPALAAEADSFIEAEGMADRVAFQPGDFFRDRLPSADVVVMSLILHNWGDGDKIRLIAAAFDALPPGGMLVAIDNLLDDDRRERLPALLGSVNMLLQTSEGRGYTAAQFRRWAADAGFREVTTEHLSYSLHAAIARK